MTLLRGLILVPALLLCAQPASDTPLRGYSASSSRSQRVWEAKFAAIPDPKKIGEYMQRLSARPHHIGSPYDKDNAEWILATLAGWGLDAKIETFDVLFPTPTERVLEMTAPRRFKAKLQEPAVPGDSTSGQHSEQLPTYNAYSIDGDVTAPLVYVNQGVPEDYEQLERRGISVKGAIVIARYGGSWRGIKPKVAGEHGAVGCIIYSDPHEDGYAQGEVFPAGPWRPRDGVQRGSVMDMPVYPGDPLTPGIGATRDARRLEISKAPTITKIPVLPISYADAKPLLAALEGPVAPAAWRGSLPITYRIGPGPARVHLKVKFDWKLHTLYNVIATIPGAGSPDEWILRGNHHDAWVNGADDPVSGAAAELEEMRALAALLKQGWRPRRTIVYAFWDGEEQGLLGSTEWAEQHAEELSQKAAVYINSDSNGRGYLKMAGSHTLEKFINGVARDVQDPEKNLPVWKRLQLERIANSTDRAEARQRADLRIEALGSGSDYTVFLDHLAVASLNLGYAGEAGGGIYHSIYDDFYWYRHFSDSGFVYGRALAQTAGIAVLRLADADMLPYDFTNFTDTVRRYVGELQKLAAGQREQIIERNRQIDEGVFSAIDDSRNPAVPPAREPVPPFLNFAPLENGVAALQREADRFEKALEHASANGGEALAGPALRDVNRRLLAVERALMSEHGLPNRPWYRHQIYAPGFYTGYGVKTIPAVRESVEQKLWKQADEQITLVGRILENTGERIQGAASALEKVRAPE